MIGGCIRPGEQCAIESEVNTYFACPGLYTLEDRLAQSASSWNELLIGIVYPSGVAQTRSNREARRTAYAEPREDSGNCGG
jgi:hypothetical protein